MRGTDEEEHRSIGGNGNTLYETITMDSNNYAPAQPYRM